MTHPHTYASGRHILVGQHVERVCDRCGLVASQSDDCPVAMREHIATLTATLRDLRAQLDYIAHVGWDASCEAAAADALEAEDATRLNRYAVRVARERDEARAELDALLVERTGMDSAGWAAERASHDAFMVAENRRGGAVECPDCGRIRFVDGGPDIDLSPSRCQMCERKAADTEVAQLRRTLSALDCRHTGAGVADVSGSHCPLGKPCERCAGERGREEARSDALREAVAVLRGLAREYIARHGGGGDYCAGVFDAASRIEALTTTTNRSDDAR